MTWASSFPKLVATGPFGMFTVNITASRTNSQGPVSETHGKRTSPQRGDTGRSFHRCLLTISSPGIPEHQAQKQLRPTIVATSYGCIDDGIHQEFFVSLFNLFRIYMKRILCTPSRILVIF